MSDCEMDCGYCMSNCTNRADAPDGICSSKMVKCPFELGAEWMQEQKQAEVDELNDKVSELTEALDASHVFCEGVNERFIKKAYRWFCDNALNYIEYNEWDGYNVNYSELEKDFKQAIKGE